MAAAGSLAAGGPQPTVGTLLPLFISVTTCCFGCCLLGDWHIGTCSVPSACHVVVYFPASCHLK